MGIRSFWKEFWTNVTKKKYFAIFHISKHWGPNSVKSKVTAFTFKNDLYLHSNERGKKIYIYIQCTSMPKKCFFFLFSKFIVFSRLFCFAASEEA